MFRLIKLAMYAVIGYVLYELYQGMTQQRQQQGDRSFGGGGGTGNSFGGPIGAGEHGGALTGGGSGMIDTAADTDGGAMRHTVGRGVVSRSPTV